MHECLCLLLSLLVGASSHVGNTAAGTSAERSLQGLTVLPSSTKLMVGTNPALATGQSVTLYGGIAYSPVSIDVTPSGTTFGSPLLPSLRLVQHDVSDAQAPSGACQNGSLQTNVTAAPYGGLPGASILLINPGYVGMVSASLTFFMGGSFRFCYSDDGSFSAGHVDILEFGLTVHGVFDDCTGFDCLGNKPYRCHVRKHASNPVGSCMLAYDRAGQGFAGPYGKVTWTPSYVNATYTADGKSLYPTASNKTCGAAGEEADNHSLGTDGFDRFIDPTAVSGQKRVMLPQSFDTLSGSNLSAFTVAACYCPDYSGCDSHEDFVQQIGVLYFYLSKLCVDELCNTDYASVLTKVDFLVKVQCPPGGCSYSNSSRVKLVSASIDNGLPSWDVSSGCRLVMHRNDFMPAGNCHSATACTFDGGRRQDYKVFRGASNISHFSLPGEPESVASAGAERYDLRNNHTSQSFDVCFCDSKCSLASSWFQVGGFHTVPLRLVGHSSFGQPGDVHAVEYALLPGMLGLLHPGASSDTLGIQPGGLLKILSDNDLKATDSTCAAGLYDASLINGPGDAASAQLYSGAVGAGSNAGKVIFNGGVASRRIIVSRAGIVAVCYCGVTKADGTCLRDGAFKLAARLTIKGPKLGQQWMFSVNVVSRIEYEGWGLESANRLRIVSKSLTCTSNNGNPGGQDPALHVGCPGACAQVRNSPGSEANITTQIWSYSQARCNKQNQGCSVVYLTNLDTTTLAHATQIQQSRTILTFSKDPMFEDGDAIALGDNISGGSVEQRATMRGIFPFADAGTYMTGLSVKRYGLPGSGTYVVSAGWLRDSAPSLMVASSAGHWKRRNKGSTKEEILSTAQRLDMKVCWAPSSETAYSSEIGTVSFVDPPSMVTASLSLVSPITDQSLPVILAFETGAVLQYTTAANSMSLRFLVTTVDFLEVDFADGMQIPPTQSTVAVASRSICGLLFSELWSSDGRGFPYPKSCHYGPDHSHRNVRSREIFITFEAKSGLAPNARYQIVMRATARTGIRAGDEVLHVFSMDDSVVHPYLAVELGRAALSRTPVPAATGMSPRLASVFLTQGTGSGLRTLDDNHLPVELELSGSSSGPVTAGTHLRIILRPLTLWKLGSRCVVTCTPSASTHSCGDAISCVGEKIVASESNNILHMELPTALTPITGSVKPYFSLYGLSRPVEGFFPTRMAAQTTDANDLSPQYLESTGAYLFKRAHSNGHTVASVVATDGNNLPFKSNAGNTLYLRIAFTATLLSKVADEAYFTITLPQGYSCTNVSGVEANLAILDLEPLPQRRGMLSGSLVNPLSDGAWTFNGNECAYYLWKDNVIYAGSTIYLKLAVTNPASPMQALSSQNKLNLSLHSRGEMTWGSQAMPLVGFGLPGPSDRGSLTSSVSVLGKLSEALVQPTSFLPGSLQSVKVFFRTEQNAGRGASLLLSAPEDFDFGLQCSAADLEDTTAYSAGAVPVTRRLPEIAKCSGKAVLSNSAAHNQATVKVSGAIEAATRYAFEVIVQNAAQEAFSLAMLSGWHLQVITSSGDGADGLDQPLKLFHTDSIALCWGLYRSVIDPSISFTLSSYTPYSLSLKYATITVSTIRLKSNATSKLRITAPFGYSWIVTGATTKYRQSDTPGTTADLPGGLPSLSLAGSALVWNAASYKSTETYGFITQIQVPDTVPTTSVNAFFFEFGNWESGNIADRHEAGMVSASQVHALQDAAVASSHNVEQLPVNLTLQVRTISTIPQGGGLLVSSPAGFYISPSCITNTVSESLILPAGTTCTATVLATGVVQILLTAANFAIPAGLYRLRLEARNPNAASNVASSSTPCGYEQCWVFQSLKDVGNLGASVDRAIAAASFSVYKPMPYATLVNLSSAQRLAICQNDKPAHTSRLVLATRLAQDATVAGIIRVRAPTGTTFHADCLGGIMTALDRVFGSSELWPGAPYEPWPSQASVISCEGNANIAILHVQPGLQANKTYPWQMELRSTAPSQPADNTWGLEYNGEASVPFASFDLWTFTNTSLVPLTMAQSSPLALSEPTIIVMLLTFQQQHAMIGGMLQLTAPPGFQFLHQHGVCSVELQRVAGVEVGYVFGGYDFVCNVDASREFALSLDFGIGVTMAANAQHVLTVRVKSPIEAMQARTWTLQSFMTKSTDLSSSLDELKINPFGVVPVIPLWSVVPVANSSDLDIRQNKGLTPVIIQIRATTPSSLHPGDALKVLGPTGFKFIDLTNSGHCSSFEWYAPAISERGTRLASLGTNSTNVTCSLQGEIKIVYNGASNVEAGSHLSFRVRTTNPRMTPRWSGNFWRFEHHRGNSLQAAGISTGYTIIPQLEDLLVSAVGPLLAAQSVSSVNVSFRVVSGCNALRISVLSPPDFDFTSAAVYASVNGAAVSELVTLQGASTTQNAVDIDLVAEPDQIINLNLAGVRFGRFGGVTQWSVETFAGGVQNDELSAQGFRLPGLVTILQSELRNELDSELSPPPRDAAEIALMSSWIPRARSPAMAEFSIRFSNPVPASTELHVSSGIDYSLLASNLKMFPYNTTGHRALISTTPLLAGQSASSSIVVVLLDALLQNKDYVIILPLHTASKSTSVGRWRFELYDGAPLPMQTNDGQLPSFKLAEVLSIGVSVGHAPPSADIRVRLTLDVGGSSPTMLSILPPVTYSFPSNCSTVASVLCTVASDKGRTVALLTLPGGQAFNTNLSFDIKVLSPSVDPPQRAWLVQGLAVPPERLISVGVAVVQGEQVAWGEYRIGVMLTPMKNIVIHYAAVPLIITALSVSFDVTYRNGKRPVALRIVPPTSYRIACAPRYLKLVSLPEQNATCTPEPFTLRLSHGSAFPEGRQVVTLEVRVPSTTPQTDSFFRIMLLDLSDVVLDSNMEGPAKLVQSQLLQTDQALLEWTSSAKGAETTVTFGFRLKRSLPPSGGSVELIGDQPIQVAALLLEMPTGFQHLITVSSDVKNLKSKFPVATQQRWSEYDTNGVIGSFFAGNQSEHNLQMLRIIRDQSQRVPVETYGFSLPVQVPAVMPRNNVWHLSLCSTVTCSSRDDASVVVSFVLPGFNHGEASPPSRFAPTPWSASPRQADLCQALWSLIVVGLVASVASA